MIVDQHFLKRQRENRLFGLVLAESRERGVGVDEATALLVEDGRKAEVVGGPGHARRRPGWKGRTLLPSLRPGERFDLVKRRRE